MKNLKKTHKIISFLLGISSVCFLTSGIASLAIENKANLKNASLENSFVRLTVEQNEKQGEYLKFKVDSTGGQVSVSEDDNTNLTYKNFYSGYTTLKINGNLYIYGKGEDVEKPHYDVEKKCHISSQKFDDVVIEQTLTFSQLDTPDYDDTIKISYKVLEHGEYDELGVRVLIDPMIGEDDKLSIYADKVQINNESEFNSTLPSEWKVYQLKNDSVFAYGKNDKESFFPNRIVFANWNELYDNKWDIDVDINREISDAAVAVRWDPVSVENNSEFSTYYGIKNIANTGKTNKVILASPKTGDAALCKIGACFMISLVTAVGSIIIKRKEKRYEK